MNLLPMAVVIGLYVAALFLAECYTVKKLGARSGLFGTGLVTMFTGFIWHKLMEVWIIDYLGWRWEESELDVLARVLYDAILIMSLCGIAMMAVDLVRGIRSFGIKSRPSMKKCMHPPRKSLLMKRFRPGNVWLTMKINKRSSEGAAETPLHSCYAPFLLRRNKRICRENFVKKSEIVLDKPSKQWYHNRACVGILCAYCDDAGDCVEKTVTSAEYVRSSGG